MNTQRLKKLDKLFTELEKIQMTYQTFDEALPHLKKWYSEFEDVYNDEVEVFENWPEGLQASEQGQRSECAISTMEDIMSEVDELMSNADEDAEDREDHYDTALGAFMEFE